MSPSSIENPNQINLIGTRFVKEFREYLISLYQQNKRIEEKEVIKRALLERNVTPETTKRYIRELKEYGII